MRMTFTKRVNCLFGISFFSHHSRYSRRIVTVLELKPLVSDWDNATSIKLLIEEGLCLNNWLIALKTGCTIISIIPFSLNCLHRLGLFHIPPFPSFDFIYFEARIKERKDPIKIIKCWIPNCLILIWCGRMFQFGFLNLQ